MEIQFVHLALKVTGAFLPWCWARVSELRHAVRKTVRQWNGGSEQESSLFTGSSNKVEIGLAPPHIRAAVRDTIFRQIPLTIQDGK